MKSGLRFVRFMKSPLGISCTLSHPYGRNMEKAAKLSRNLGPPTSVLHIANIAEGLTHHDIKVGAHC